MGLGHSPSIVTSGLILCLDAGNIKSYPGYGTALTDLSGSGNTGTLTNGPTFNSYDSRTNGNLYSNDVTNAYYTKFFVTTGASSETAPDGTTTASYFTLSSTSTTYKGVVGNYINYPTSSIVTISCFVKPTGGARYFWIREGGYGASRVGFDLTSISVFSSSYATGYISAAGNGWYRVQAVMGALPQSSARVQLLGTSDTTPPGNANVSSTGTETYHIWGAQCELGAFATSPMLTTSSTVTRSSGAATLVFDGINDSISLGTSSSINAASTAFTWSCWYKSNSISAAQLLFSNVPASLANGWSPQIYGSKFLLQVFPSQTYAYANTVLSNSAWYNLAVTYNSGAVVYYLNGVADGTASYTFTAATGPTYISSWAYGSSYFINGSVSQVLMYNAVLTAAQVLQNYNALRGRFGL